MDSNNSKKNRLKSTGNKLIRRMGSSKSKKAPIIGQSTNEPISASVSSATHSLNKDKSADDQLQTSLSTIFTSNTMASNQNSTDLSKKNEPMESKPFNSANISSINTASTNQTSHIFHSTKPSSKPASPQSGSRPASRPGSRPGSRIISRVQSRTSLLEESGPSRSSHSYSNFFSSTNLQKLGLDASRPLSSRTGSKIGAEGSFESESPNLLYRSGSRLWEEARETKGQSWLGFRHSSSSSLDNDTEDAAKPRDRPAYHRAYTAHEAESDVDNDDMVLHFTPRDPTTTQAESPTKASSGVLVLKAVDWLLGIKQESHGLTVALQPEIARKPLTKMEKTRQRDGDHESTIDLAWLLAVIAGYELY